MHASIVIATLNRGDYLASTIQMALGQKGIDFEIIVIDQTLDYSPEIFNTLEKLLPKVIYIKSSVNSASHARNLGIKAATGEVILFIDDDVVFDSFLLAQHKDIHKNFPTAGAVCGVIIEKNWEGDLSVAIKTRLASYYPRPNTEQDSVIPITWAPSGNISYKRKVLLDVMGFDETLKTYAEDFDLSLRIQALGHKLLFSYTPALIHLAAIRGGCEQRDEALSREKRLERIWALHYVFFKNLSIIGLRILSKELWRSFRFESLNVKTLRLGISDFILENIRYLRVVIDAFCATRPITSPSANATTHTKTMRK